MEIFSLLVAAAGSQAVKALVRGAPPTQDDVASVASEATGKVLAALLESQTGIEAALGRLDAKVDKLLREPFEGALRTGYGFLAEAHDAVAAPEDRKAFLDAALKAFVEAAAAARATGVPDTARAEAELLVAACYLAKGNLNAFHVRCSNIADWCWSRISAASTELEEPSYWAISEWIEAHPPGRAEMAVLRARKGSVAAREVHYERARASLRRDILDRRDELVAALNEVQTIRAAFGQQPDRCPRLVGIVDAVVPHVRTRDRRPGEPGLSSLVTEDVPWAGLPLGAPKMFSVPVFELPFRSEDVHVQVIDGPRLDQDDECYVVTAVVEATFAEPGDWTATAAAGGPLMPAEPARERGTSDWFAAYQAPEELRGRVPVRCTARRPPAGLLITVGGARRGTPVGERFFARLYAPAAD